MISLGTLCLLLLGCSDPIAIQGTGDADLDQARKQSVLVAIKQRSMSLPAQLLVTRENLEPGLRALEQHLPNIRRSWPSLAVADLRFSRQIVFQPAHETPMEG